MRGRLVWLLMALALVSAAFLVAIQPAYARGETPGAVWVPAHGIQRDTVVIELVMPLAKRREARRKMEELRSALLRRTMRPMNRGDTENWFGKCTVMPDQKETGAAVLRVECWSLSLEVNDVPSLVWEAFEEPGEVLVFIDAFLIKHRERLLHTVPRPRHKPLPPTIHV